MKTRIVTTAPETSEPRRLILFFAGWGMDSRPFTHLGREGYDTAVVWDYSDPEPIPAELLAPYGEICVVAWSFGVPYAARFIAASRDRQPITRCIAVNGTLSPVDDLRGIPADLFHATLRGLTPRSVEKFNRRMTGGGAASALFTSSAPERSIESLAAELERVEADGEAPDPGFDSVYISGADRIIPPDNQHRAWHGRAPIKELGPDSPHMPDFNRILATEMADKRLISISFGRVGSTYEAEAAIQQEAAATLSRLWAEHATPLPDGDLVEFGVGTGMLTRHLRSSGRTIRLYDLAPLSPEVVSADAETMIASMIADGPTAGILSASTIQWFNSPARFLRRALLALPSGAWLGISNFGPTTYRELAPFQQSRPAYMDGDALRDVALKLVAEGVASPDFIAIDGPERVVGFATVRELIAHIRRSGVNATRLPGASAARALLAVAPNTLTYAPSYLLIRKK